MKRLILSLLCWQIAACGPQDNHEKSVQSQAATGIVGGTNVIANSREARPVVMIATEDGGTLCTGTLISKDLVLSAGHCLLEDVRELRVIFGLDPLNTNTPVARPVIAAKRHELYKASPTERNDIAILKFKGPLPQGVSIAELPDEDDPIQLQADFTSIGYGQTRGRVENFEPDGAGVLRQVTMKINAFHYMGKGFSSDQTKGFGICYGDSGGPGMIWRKDGTPVTIGVISGVYYEDGANTNAPDFDKCKQRSLYMNVLAYREWIVNASLELRGYDLAKKPSKSKRVRAAK